MECSVNVVGQKCWFLQSIRKMRHAAGAALLLGLAASASFGSSLTVGTFSDDNAFPFGGPYYGYTGTDYQEAYASNDFSGPVLISGIDFFLAPGFTGSVYSGTYTLTLSIISSDIGSLSSTDLASNIGSDATVFETETLSGKAPNELTFTGTPFLYDPSLGNLLLDISVAGGTGGSGVAFEDNGGVGTALARYQNFGANDGDGWGLVTEFDSASGTPAVPEPGTLPLVSGALGALVVFARLRKRQVSQ
jgi:hypothetical protein